MASIVVRTTVRSIRSTSTRPQLCRDESWHAPFRTLRATAPVHRYGHSAFGPYWLVSCRSSGVMTPPAIE